MRRPGTRWSLSSPRGRGRGLSAAVIALILHVIFLQLLLGTPCYAQFELKDIPGSYQRVLPSTDSYNGCPFSISFTSAMIDLPAASIRFSGRNCRTGVIVFATNPEGIGNEFTKELMAVRQRLGDIITGRVGAAIECSQTAGNLTTSAPSGFYFNLVKPKKNFRTIFANIFGPSSVLAKTGKGEYTFLRNRKYIVAGDKCVYKQIGEGGRSDGNTPESRGVGQDAGGPSYWPWLGPVLGAVVLVIGAVVTVFAAREVRARKRRGSAPVGIDEGGVDFEDDISTSVIRRPPPVGRFFGPAPPGTSMSTLSGPQGASQPRQANIEQGPQGGHQQLHADDQAPRQDSGMVQGHMPRYESGGNNFAGAPGAHGYVQRTNSRDP